MGLLAEAAAGILCLLGALLALQIAGFLQDPKMLALGFMAGMLPRMGIPIGGVLFLHLQMKPLAEAGILYYLLLFYPITLALETAFILPSPTKPFSGKKSDSKQPPDAIDKPD
jgi:hypothetical protein